MRAIAPALVAGILAASLTAGPSVAATATGTMAVSASVTATCVVAASTLPFGAYAAVQIDTVATLTVTCTNTVPYDIGLSAGSGSGATVAIRKMTSAAGTLNYTVYRESGRTTVWGTTVGTDTVAGTGTGLAQALSAYGRMPVGQYGAPGNYADTLIATVNY